MSEVLSTFSPAENFIELVNKLNKVLQMGSTFYRLVGWEDNRMLL